MFVIIGILSDLITVFEIDSIFLFFRIFFLMRHMHSLANTKIEVSGSERTHETKCILQHSRPYVNAHSVVAAVPEWELFVNFLFLLGSFALPFDVYIIPYFESNVNVFFVNSWL